jgi:hypothetical protein
MKSTAVLFLIVVLLGLQADASACGDSLYRAGKSISYRVYTVPLAGNVLVYGHTEGARQLAEALSESGHSVELAESEVDLGLMMQSGNYDVVIASYGEHDAIEATVGDSAAATTYLPVALNRQEAKIAGQSYDKVMLADQDEIKDYLKAIHQTLKSKAS